MYVNGEYRGDEKGVQMASKIVEEYGDERAAEALKQGLREGEIKKSIEGAIILIKDFNATPELAAQKMNAPFEKVLEALAKEG